MTDQGALFDTYVAAVQHDLVDLPADVTLVGVVRRPTGWFHAVVDENHPVLGPPDALLTELQRRQATYEDAGEDEAVAHESAWRDLDFEERYAEYLETDPDARQAANSLVDRLRGGESLALVCFENTEQKRCHRTRLKTHLSASLDDD